MIAIDEPELTPQQSEAVRRLLAGARHDEPMPPEVAARLDGVLADLRAEDGSTQAAPPAEDNVTPMRRRSKLPQMLLAAAAVVAVGFGVTQMLPTGEDSESGGDSSISADQAPEAESRQDQDPTKGAQPPGDASHEAQLDKNLATARAHGLIDRVPIPGLSSSPHTGADRVAHFAECGPESLNPGQRRTAASYDGDPAVVVFRAERDRKQQPLRIADVYLCTSYDPRTPMTTVRLTAP